MVFSIIVTSIIIQVLSVLHWGIRGTEVTHWTAGQQVERSILHQGHDSYKIHLISPCCPRPCIVLKHQSFNFSRSWAQLFLPPPRPHHTQTHTVLGKHIRYVIRHGSIIILSGCYWYDSITCMHNICWNSLNLRRPWESTLGGIPWGKSHQPYKGGWPVS